jgi:hypothetical protein
VEAAPFATLFDDLALRSPTYAARFRRRILTQRPPTAPRVEFYPRLPALGAVDDAIRSCAAAAGLPASSLTAAVESARCWRRRPMLHPPEPGALPHPFPLGAALASFPGTDTARAYVSSLASHGADSMYAGRRVREWRDNHASAYLLAHVVDAEVASHVARRWLVDVTDIYRADPLLPALVSPVGVVPKPNKPGAYRLILDGSSHPARCVNDFCETASLPVPSLATADQLRDEICRLKAARPGVRVLLHVADCKDAYKQVPVRAECWWTLTQVWRGRVYWNVKLPFGLRPASHHLETVTSAMGRGIAALCGRTPAYYVDDSALAAHEDAMPFCVAATDAVARAAAMPLNTEKLEPPAERKRFIGWDFDTASMTMSLPDTKLQAIRAAVASFSTSRRIRAGDLSSLLGTLANAARGVRHMRASLASLRACASSAGARRWVVLSHEARLDLRFWADFVAQYNGVTLLSPPPPSATVWCDASTSWGWGWFCPDLNLFGHGPWSDEPDIAHLHVNALECVTGLAASLLVGDLLPDGSRSVRLRSDSTAACATLTKCAGAPGVLARLARALAFFKETRHLSIAPLHVQGVKNPIADALSRGLRPQELATATRVTFPQHWLSDLCLSERPWARATAPTSATAPGGPASSSSVPLAA